MTSIQDTEECLLYNWKYLKITAKREFDKVSPEEQEDIVGQALQIALRRKLFNKKQPYTRLKWLLLDGHRELTHNRTKTGKAVFLQELASQDIAVGPTQFIELEAKEQKAAYAKEKEFRAANPSALLVEIESRYLLNSLPMNTSDMVKFMQNCNENP